MRMRAIALLTAVFAALAFSAAALANTCVNVKRPTDKDPAFTTKGNWVNVEDAWLFVSPGTNVEEEFGVPIHLPGENGNFTNGQTDSLLGTSATCDPNKSPQSGDSRGIQTGCE
jgi:hypothetical protein